MNKALKDLIQAVSDLSLLISTASDGFSFSEVTELVNAAKDIAIVAKEAPALLAQYKALDDAGRTDLVSFVENNVTFPANQNIQDVIQKVLEAAIALSALVEIL